tara:strand:+ start:24379 stop:25434 length:1056 start_codon:yes stop_codon:yes gene_type:complete
MYSTFLFEGAPAPTDIAFYPSADTVKSILFDITQFHQADTPKFTLLRGLNLLQQLVMQWQWDERRTPLFQQIVLGLNAEPSLDPNIVETVRYILAQVDVDYANELVTFYRRGLICYTDMALEEQLATKHIVSSPFMANSILLRNFLREPPLSDNASALIQTLCGTYQKHGTPLHTPSTLAMLLKLNQNITFQKMYAHLAQQALAQEQTDISVDSNYRIIQSFDFLSKNKTADAIEQLTLCVQAGNLIAAAILHLVLSALGRNTTPLILFFIEHATDYCLQQCLLWWQYFMRSFPRCAFITRCRKSISQYMGAIDSNTWYTLIPRERRRSIKRMPAKRKSIPSLAPLSDGKQ